MFSVNQRERERESQIFNHIEPLTNSSAFLNNYAKLVGICVLQLKIRAKGKQLAARYGIGRQPRVRKEQNGHRPSACDAFSPAEGHVLALLTIRQSKTVLYHGLRGRSQQALDVNVSTTSARCVARAIT